MSTAFKNILENLATSISVSSMVASEYQKRLKRSANKKSKIKKVMQNVKRKKKTKKNMQSPGKKHMILQSQHGIHRPLQSHLLLA
jgi:Flp pilus assembly protein TadB